MGGRLLWDQSKINIRPSLLSLRYPSSGVLLSGIPGVCPRGPPCIALYKPLASLSLNRCCLMYHELSHTLRLRLAFSRSLPSNLPPCQLVISLASCRMVYAHVIQKPRCLEKRVCRILDIVACLDQPQDLSLRVIMIHREIWDGCKDLVSVKPVCISCQMTRQSRRD